MRNAFSMAALAIGLFTLAADAAEQKLQLTGKNTEIKFVGTKPDGKHDGGFKTVAGEIVGDGATWTKIEVDIDMNSTWSDDEKLTGHLKSPDFFGVKANPKSKFVSTKIEPTATGAKITGDLTLNGKTKSITFPATVEKTTAGFVLKSDFKINRGDFGITYGQGKISEEVAISFKVDSSKK